MPRRKHRPDGAADPHLTIIRDDELSSIATALENEPGTPRKKFPKERPGPHRITGPRERWRELAASLRALMKSDGLSAGAAARRLGISPSHARDVLSEVFTPKKA